MNDLISRKALCDYALNQKDKSVTPNDIMRFPSAQPLTAYVISDEDGNIKCSNCGSSQCWGNYCMDCGAKMY